jgi:hypothetical protein
MIITPKLRNQKPKKKHNFEETFWFSRKRCFLFSLFFLGFEMQKKNLFFLCLVIFSNHKPSKKQKKHNVFSAFAFQSQKNKMKIKKKHFLRINENVSS